MNCVCLFLLGTLQLLSFLAEIPSIRLIVVVGGADEHLPSLPRGTGVTIVSYQKLLSQVAFYNGF
jgi:hypothetical protein